DTGYSQIGVLHNMAMLKADPSSIEAIVLSHSHMDHIGGLFPILEKIGKRIQLVAHPDVFLYPRYLSLETGDRLLFPEFKREEVEQKAELVESKGPVCIADDMALVTGEVERTTAFETGLPNALVERGGETEKDITTDDQAILVNLKGKGLVVIGGCSHAGIINTIRYGQKITNISKTYAVIGGFHLAGAFYENIIDDTIGEMKKISPEIMVPMHCTGWNAIKRFSEEFPSSFVLNSVGAKFLLT
ncbi:MAG: MBL fold metallo-hydrolase, partial [Deltaproteobacteria bacterium]|nr:MBL fold metallo-hydrolase [Deltaproteobacteria bacterium]